MAIDEMAAPEKDSDACVWEQRAFYLLFLYFTVKAVYFAINIHSQVFPDEASWFGIINVFSRSNLPPTDSPESFPLGLITHIPNLYFFLMGKILSLNPLRSQDLVVMRLVNVAMGLTTVLFAWRLGRLLLPSVAGRLLFLVMLTNTLMFTFITGAVNYDNLSTLFAVLSLYYLVLFQRQRLVGSLLWFMVFLLAGTLTKNVFLPYATALAMVFLICERKVIFSTSWLRQLGGSSFSWFACGKILIILILFVLNLNLYVGNKIRYGHLIPSMEQVLPVENCLQNRLFARGYVVRQYKTGKLTMLDARRLALQIRDPGDRAMAMDLLQKAGQERAEAKPARLGRLAYSLEWAEFITARLYGVAAHLALYKSTGWLWGYYAFFILSFVLLVVRFLRNGLMNLGGLLFVCLFYVYILMQVVNYNNYMGTGFVGIALTGRYLFPVIVPLYILIAHGLMSRMPHWWQWMVGVVGGSFFIWGGFPWFLQNVTPNWYGG